MSSSVSSITHQLPSDLLAHKDIFINLMTKCSIWSQLTQEKRQELRDKYLPVGLSKEDKEDTLLMLFQNGLNKFNRDSLSDVFMGLKMQKMNPELVKALDDVNNMRNKLAKMCAQKRQCQLLKEIMIKRASLLSASIHVPFGSNHIHINNKKGHGKEQLPSSQSAFKLKHQNEKRKRENEKKDVNWNKDDSEGELNRHNDYHESLIESKSAIIMSNKYGYNKNMVVNDQSYKEMLRKHRRKRKASEFSYEPMLETSGISLSDIIRRVNCNHHEHDHTYVTSLSSSSSLPLSSNLNHNKSMSHSNTGSGKEYTSTSTSISSTTTSHKKKRAKTTNKNKPCLNGYSRVTEICPNINFKLSSESDISNKSEANLNLEKVINECSKFPEDSVSLNEVKSKTYSLPLTSSNNDNHSNATYIPIHDQTQASSTDSSIPSVPQSQTHSLSVHPPLLASSPESTSTPIAYEKPPACFFSLLRDIYRDSSLSDNRLTLHKLEELVKDKLSCFEPTMIDWTTDLVAPAMNYLSSVLPPPFLIPLVDYKEKNQQWQWIGNGRDSDGELTPLCQEWMKNKEDDLTNGFSNLNQSIPPINAIKMTDWVVRASNIEEKTKYRKQEAIRYNNPSKAFTYRIHGYESVVGPVKGCGIGGANFSNTSPNKAREHSLLISDRPPFVTLLSLVRDAAARLPNGEGTRADICELLKDSQYLLPNISDQQVNGIVSGALDRLHYEKDPCVKYDVNRKVWIYLHRNRDEHEFERLHQVMIAAAKAKRSMGKTCRNKTNGNTNSSAQANVNNNSNEGKLSVSKSNTNANMTSNGKPNNVSNHSQTSNKQSNQPIISNATQQAIHQAVTNILNSEALKITPTTPTTSPTHNIIRLYYKTI